MTTTRASELWTHAERDAINRTNVFATITGAEVFRALATVDALEEIARHFDERDCARNDPPPGPFPCEYCNTVTDPILAALESK